MNKFDIHSHLLPGIDDGAVDTEMSLQMLQVAVREGICKIIATPHYSAYFQNTDPDRIRQMCRELEEEAVRKGLDVQIYPGQELLASADGIEQLRKRKILTLADSRYILVEFLPGTPYSVITGRIREIVSMGYVPVLAHIERYSALRTPGRVEELVDSGARMQMNYQPVGEKWHRETTRWCRKMLGAELVQFLGTDMHDLNTRKPETEDAQRWMRKHLDAAYLRAISYENAEKIVNAKNERG